MSSRDDKCSSCSSHENKDGLYCSLSPVRDGVECSCLTCLVISICRASDDDCDRYLEFGKIQ